MDCRKPPTVIWLSWPHTQTEACDWLICAFNQGLAFLHRSALAVGAPLKETALDCKIQSFKFWRARLEYRAEYFDNKSGVKPRKASQF